MLRERNKTKCPKCGSGPASIYQDYIISQEEIGFTEDLACMICGNRWREGEPEKKEKEEIKMRKNSLKICADCGKVKTHRGRGLCGGCYGRNKREGTLPPLLVGVDRNPTPEMSSRTIILVFSTNDMVLYKNVVADAKLNRRSVEQHILWILQEQTK